MSTGPNVSHARFGPAGAPETETLVRGRFEVRRLLGQGSFGGVYEAFDQKAGELVAVKTLERSNAESLLRFKQEFRSLQDLSHRNLVQLRELIECDGRWHLVMELIPGEELREYVRRQPTADNPAIYDEPRLRACLLQLSQALAALHAADKLHRDIKPANVRVTPGGRLVLLDFGLVTRVGHDPMLTAAGHVVGTAAYMAPEQAAGEALTPAADWYAVGAILFELLTGRLPFAGSALSILLDKQTDLRLSARDGQPWVPQDLDMLCTMLLARNPAARPNAEGVLQALLPAHQTPLPPSLLPPPAAGEGSASTRSPHFVGRRRELALLEDAFRRSLGGTLSVCHVHGESGAGKTHMVRELIYRLEGSHPTLTVLRARCHENETVAYKAVDGAIDELSAQLSALPEEEAEQLLPAGAGALAQVFPVLARVPGIGSRPWRRLNDRVAERARAFGMLRALLHAYTARTPVLLVIDDFQWTDEESLPLLIELLRSPNPPGLCLVLLTRPLSECPPGFENTIARITALDPRALSVPLGALEPAEAEEMAGALLGPGDPTRAATIAREARGHPLFIEVMSRHVARAPADRREVTLEDALHALCRALPPATRGVLEACCVAGSPIDRRTLGRACGMDGEDYEMALRKLRIHRFARVAHGAERNTVEPFHDLVRRVVVARLPEPRRRRWHLRLATALDSVPQLDGERTATHWRLGGEPARAAEAAWRAALLASDALAFRKAARLMRMALDLAPQHAERRQRLVAYGDALTYAGRMSDAAEAYLDAAVGASAGQFIELRRKAAERLLQAGRLERGLQVADDLLGSVGLKLPPSRSAALTTATWHMLRRRLRGERFTPRSEEKIPHDRLARIDALWSVGASLGPVRPFLAAALQAQHFTLALATGETGRIAQAMALDVFGLYFMGRTERARARAAQAELLASEADRPDVLAVVRYSRAFVDLNEGYIGAARRALQEVVENLRTAEIPQLWLRATAESPLLWTLCEGERWDAIAAQVPRAMRECLERGDPSVVAWMSHVAALDCIRAGDIPGARDAMTADPDFPVPYKTARFARTVDVYERPDQLQANRAAQFKQAGGYRLAEVACCGHVEDTIAEVRLSRGRPKISPAAKHHLTLAKKAARSDALRAYVTLAEATYAHGTGRDDQAVELLRVAERELSRVGRELCATLARVRRAQLEGGEQGAAALARFEDGALAQGVRDPLRLYHALLPGFLDL